MRRNWTPEEVRYLETKYNKKGVDFIAKKLDRTKDSIKRKAQTLGYNAYICEDLYMKTVAKSFNCDISVIKRWVNKFGLPCRYIQRGSIRCGLINADEFWKWASDHKNIIPWAKYEKFSILPEPEWLKELPDEYKIKHHRSKISNYEIDYVVRQRKAGHSFKEIANELGRTEHSVKHIWRNRPVRKEY